MCQNLQLFCAVIRIYIYSFFRRMCGGDPPAVKPNFTVLCLGLSKTGKSTLLSVLSGESTENIEPTVGFSIKALIFSNCIVDVKELGGGDSVRPYWDKYFGGAEGIIFVVDSSAGDEDLQLTNTTLHQALADPELDNLPLMVLCNYSDKEGSKSKEELQKILELDLESKSRHWEIHSCTSSDRDSIRVAFESFNKKLLERKGGLHKEFILAMSELEEGEITDSDNDNESQTKKDENKTSLPTSTSSHNMVVPAVSYRSSKPHPEDSEDSDSSSYSDEDTPLWRCKKAKYFSSSRHDEKSMVTELPEEIKSPIRKNDRPASRNVNPQTAKRKINNIWGSVLTEQSLTQDLKDVGVKTLTCDDSRNVEKYDFTLKYNDTRPDLANELSDSESHDPFNKVVDLPEMDANSSRKRKRTRKERRPVKERVKMHDDRDFEEPLPDLEADKIVKMITRKLNEPKVYLIERIYRIIGKEKTLDLFYKTQDIEEAGGLLIQNKTRRRSPGGVFIHLLKSDKSVSPEQVDEIFAKEEQEFIQSLEERKQKRKEQKQRRKERRKLTRLLPQSKLMQKPGVSKVKGDLNSEKKPEVTMEMTDSENESLHSEPEDGLHVLDVDDKDVVDIDIGVDETID
ncbi:phosphorylated adapter RNA export protein-like [Saccostrea cucullata]|uniref:phosphorylated adapter RNA export protein-like n=1 Tax=Saccostrea cuccullata TaxID=36930 RepID=UPI002ED5D88B